MEPTHPDRVVENVTAPSAGGFPGPDGEGRLRMRLPFRTGFSHRGLRAHSEIPPCAIDETAPTSAGLLSDGKGLAHLPSR
ncbi:MAG: hypothetical protein ACOX52_07620 [Verrucomicrobiota bacterium]